MHASGRAARSLAPNKKQQALASLAQLKQGGLKRTEQFTAVEEEDVYDDIDEDAYQDLVRKRREDDFIEDDDGGGYVDFGQEDWEEGEEGDDDPERKRAKGDNGDKKKGVFNSLAPRKKKATERVNAMFLGAGREAIGPNQAKKSAATDADGGDELLSSLLTEVEQDPMGVRMQPKRNPFGKRSAAADALAAARPAMPSYKPGAAMPGGGGGRGGGDFGSGGFGGGNDLTDYSRTVPKMNMAMFDDDEGTGGGAEGTFGDFSFCCPPLLHAALLSARGALFVCVRTQTRLRPRRAQPAGWVASSQWSWARAAAAWRRTRTWAVPPAPTCPL